MNTETTPISLVSQQARLVLGWFTAKRLNRGALLYWAVLFTLSAAIIRLAGMITQLPQSDFLVAFLLSASIVQLAAALAVVVVPARRLLLASAIVEGGAMLMWLLAHTTGLPIGPTIWRPEILGLPDFYLPFMEITSGFFFLCLFWRTWTLKPGIGHRMRCMLPTLFLMGLLAGVVIGAIINLWGIELLFAHFFKIAGLPNSLLSLFLPATGLLMLLLLLRVVFPRLRARTPRAGRTILVLLPALLMISLLTWAGSFTAATRGWFPDSSTLSVPAGQTTTLAYCRFGGSPLAMDITEPAAQTARPAPMVFYVHGGAGFQGSRDLKTDFEGSYWLRLRNDLVKRGFVVGSIDYSLIPLSSLEDMVKEAKCAVRFLRAHASELGIDGRRIGVYGDSEGGYIGAMLGTAGPQAGFDAGQYLNQASRVQAVVDIAGYTDLTDFSGSPSWVRPFGDGRSLAELRTASPFTYVRPGDPPFLIIHGTDDGLIAPHHSLDLARRLRAAGVPTTLLMVQHGGHGLDEAAPGAIQQPDADAQLHIISNFFVRTLGA